MAKSTTVVVRTVRRVPAPGRDAPPMRVTHYGNGWNGSNVKPKPANQPTQPVSK